MPRPRGHEVLLQVHACAVCRTDLHVSEGDLAVHRPRVVPGHEVVGEVVELGPGDSNGFAVGDRVGVAWLRHTCGQCRYCLRGRENLCPQSLYTGWDVDGGYAEFTTVPAAFAYRLPAGYTDSELAPLLCAGIIGYRALLRTDLPAGGRLGIYGFGGSAHLTAQVALARGARVHVMPRGARARELALALGSSSAQGSRDMPPEPRDAAILFAPVGDLVLPALAALDRGGVLAIAGIHLTDIPSLNYQRHLFQEREIRSVTANTRADARDFLAFVAEHRVEVTTPQYPQKFLTDRIAVFGTTRTVASNVYAEEIRKRCPKVTVIQQVCSELAGAIEAGAAEAELDRLVEAGIAGVLRQAGGEPPHRAILGCTHFPLVEHLFRRHLPPATRILSQPEIVADSLEDYLARHPRYRGDPASLPRLVLLTTGDPEEASARARVFAGDAARGGWRDALSFERLGA